MEDRDKLPIIIRHWIEHNNSHLEEYRRWSQKAGQLGWERVRAKIAEATEEIYRSNTSLEEALRELEAL